MFWLDAVYGDDISGAVAIDGDILAHPLDGIEWPIIWLLDGLLHTIPSHENVCADVKVLANEHFGRQCTKFLHHILENPGVVLDVAGGTRVK